VLPGRPQEVAAVGLSWRRQEALFGYLCISPFLLGLLFFSAGPMLYSIYLAMTEYDVASAPQFIGLGNFIELADDPLFWKSLRITTIYTLAAVPLGIVVGLGLAQLLNQGVRGIALWRTVYYMPSVVAGVAVSMMWVWLLNPEFGIVNHLLALVGIDGPGWLTDPDWALWTLIAMSVWGAGGSMVIYLAGLQGIPNHLYEAANIDGANAWQRVRYVTIPLITPVIFLQLILGIIGTFQIFTNAFIMTNGGPANSTLFYVLYLYKRGFERFELGYAAAMAWVLFALVMALTLVVFWTSSRWVYYEGDVRGR
jgi:multiple sugar transport system permease protein